MCTGRSNAEKLGRFPDLYAFLHEFLSGPIERGGDLLPQLKISPVHLLERSDRTEIYFAGTDKETAYSQSDSPQTDIMFHSIHDSLGVQLLMTCLLYPIELYADFSGYTDIAIGGAYLFGIKLSPNFNRLLPRTFHRRFLAQWLVVHVTLFWAADYLYVPLTAGTCT